MYDELVKRLRHSANFAERGLTPPPSGLREAADAIEELLAERNENYADSWKMAYEVERDEHRWISVEEQLPDAGEFVWAVYKNSLFPNGKSHHKTLKYVGDMWVDENGYRYLTENITHWKHRDPLPEQPKEE